MTNFSINPSPLQLGDRLMAIAPSGRLREVSAFEAGVKIWQEQGYEVIIHPDVYQGWGYLAGKDHQRAKQLQDALADDHCKGILCVRGGYGGARLLENWQWPTNMTPKWLIGFSDITGLLWSLSQRSIAGVHGPLLTTLSAEPDWSRQRLFDWVAGRSIPPLHGKGWGGGVTTGKLLPCNLTVATHFLNTPIQPSLAGVILAIEDVSEAPYRIDRMLSQWRLSGAFQGIKGIAIGRFSQCNPPDNIPSLTVEEVLRDRLGDLGLPIVSDLPFGHDGVNAALPVGVCVTLDGDRGSLSIV